MRTVELAGHKIGAGHPVHVIAEIGGNFDDFAGAKKLIDLAVEAGAHSVKLQTYRAETITSRKAVYDMPNTGNANQFALFKQYEVDLGLHQDIWAYCHEIGVPIFSTPSHISDIELLEKVDCPVYKIGSDDAWNIPFLKEVAQVGKPIILSTGMCTMEEVRESVSAILGTGNDNLVLLHCVTNYPCNISDVNLRCIPRMQEEFGLPVGFSDHTLGITACTAAAAIGAHVLEKHFTHDRNADGPDHMLSATPEELKALCDVTRDIELALGDGVKRPSAGERTTRVNNRKSIVAERDIAEGTVITKDDIAIKRPGYGIPPKHFDELLGRVAKTNIEADDVIRWGDV